MYKKIIIGASMVIGVISLVYIMNSFSAPEIFNPFQHASLFSILSFIFISFLIAFVLTARWKVINTSMGIKIPYWDLFLYRLAGYCISYVTPGPRVGGEPVMATLLKKRGINYMKSLSGMVVDKTIDAAVTGSIFILGVIVLLIGYTLPVEFKNLMIVVAVLFAGLIINFYYRMLNGKEVFVSTLRLLRLNKIKFIKQSEGRILAFERLIIKFHNKEKKAFMKSVGLSLVLTFLMYFEYAAALSILGIQVGIMDLFLIISFTGAALLLPIPAAIGSLEAGQISALAASGNPSSYGFSLAIIIRARDLMWVIMGFLLLFYFGFDIKRLVKKLFRKYVKVNKNVKIYLHN